MTDDRLEPSFSSSGPVRALPPSRRHSVAPLAATLLAVAIGAGGWFVWSKSGSPAATPASAPAAETSTAQLPPHEAASASPAPTLHPAAAEDMVRAEDITSALTRMLGRDEVLKFLDTTDFPRRFVATLDNLGREHAPLSVWPVQPTPGRFLATGDGDSTRVAAENELRYAPFVAFVGSVDAARAVDLYRRMYPVLEGAYRDLGFRGRPLNARVFEIIDLLLATPEPTQPPKVTLTEVKGPMEAPRPWTRYEYQDPGFQRLAAGQKMLLRMGAANRKVLKTKLQQLRQELLRVSSEAARP
jgi:hypothetical protein